GGSFQIDAASTATNLNLSGGTLTGGGDLTVSGIFTWTGGTQSGTGKTILASGSQLNISTGGGVTAGRPIDNTLAPINWTAGTISGTFNNIGLLTVGTGGSFDVLAGTLTNTGTITVTGAGTWSFNNSTLNNQVGGTVDVQSSPIFAASAGS